MSARDSSGPIARRPSRFRRIMFFALAALFLFYAISCLRIARQSEKDEAQPADVIVVFGAAEYAGRPSPVFRARLDHALGLFEKKLAPIVIVSGGAGNDLKFTEGGVGRDYLMSKGIGDRHLIAETQGDNTSESSERVAVIMRANGWHTAIAVSDGYHLFRIKRMMARQGIKAFVSPRAQDLKVSTGSKILTVMREALSYMLWTFHIT